MCLESFFKSHGRPWRISSELLTQLPMKLLVDSLFQPPEQRLHVARTERIQNDYMRSLANLVPHAVRMVLGPADHVGLPRKGNREWQFEFLDKKRQIPKFHRQRLATKYVFELIKHK